MVHSCGALWCTSVVHCGVPVWYTGVVYWWGTLCGTLVLVHPPVFFHGFPSPTELALTWLHPHSLFLPRPKNGEKSKEKLTFMFPPAPDVLGDDGNHLDLSWISFNPVQQGEAVLEASATWTRSSLPSLGTTRPSWLVEALVSLARESGKHWEGSLPPSSY